MAGIGADNLAANSGRTGRDFPAAFDPAIDNPFDVDDMTISRALAGREKLASLTVADHRYAGLFDFLDRWIIACGDYPVSPLVDRARRLSNFYAGGGHGRGTRRHS